MQKVIKIGNIQDVIDRVPVYYSWSGVAGSHTVTSHALLLKGEEVIPLSLKRRVKEEATPSSYYEEEGAPIREVLPPGWESCDFLLFIEEEIITFDSSLNNIVLTISPIKG